MNNLTPINNLSVTVYYEVTRSKDTETYQHVAANTIYHFNELSELYYGPLANTYLRRGLANTELGKYEEAIKDFKKAIEINPQFIEPFRNIICIYTAIQTNPDCYKSLM